MMDRLKVAVVGAGAIGTFYGMMLEQAGADVSFVARGATLAAIRRDGLRITGKRTRTIHPLVTDDPAQIGVVDAVLVCTKTFQVAPALEDYSSSLIGPDTVVVTTQNGVATPQVVADIVGRRRTCPGVCREWVKIVEPGVVDDMGGPASIHIGMLDDTQNPIVDEIRSRFESVGVTCPPVDDITTELWFKAVNVCAQGTIGAALEATLGELLTCHRDLFVRCVREWIAVGEAHGADFSPDVLEAVFAYFESQEGHLTTSFQRDITAGRASELEAQVGALPGLGDEVGVDTPLNDAFAAVLRAKAARAGH